MIKKTIPAIPTLTLMTHAEVKRLKAFYAKSFSVETARKLCAYVDALNALVTQASEAVRQGVDVASGMSPDDLHTFAGKSHKAELERLHVFKLGQALAASQELNKRKAKMARKRTVRHQDLAQKVAHRLPAINKTVETELRALTLN